MFWLILIIFVAIFILLFGSKTNSNARKKIDEELEEYLQEVRNESKESIIKSNEDARKEWELDQVKKSRDYKEYLKTLEWHTLKRQVYVRDNYRCRQCSKDLSKMNGNVHHVTYDRVYNEKLDDLVLVCPDCHQLIHTYYSRLMPGTKRFNLLSKQQYIEAIELSNTLI